MSEGEQVKRRRRRSSQEIERLVAEFRTSGLRQSEFCRIHGMTHGTLQRRLRREQIGSQAGVKGLVAVEVADGDALGRRKPQVAADWK
jgi:transposase-like protein